MGGQHPDKEGVGVERGEGRLKLAERGCGKVVEVEGEDGLATAAVGGEDDVRVVSVGKID
jgi:hypothetical protein